MYFIYYSGGLALKPNRPGPRAARIRGCQSSILNRMSAKKGAAGTYYMARGQHCNSANVYIQTLRLKFCRKP